MWSLVSVAAQHSGHNTVGSNDYRVSFQPRVPSVSIAAVSRALFVEHSKDLLYSERLDMIQLSSGYAYQVGPRVSEALLVKSQGYFRMRIEEIVRYTMDNAPEFVGL